MWRNNQKNGTGLLTIVNTNEQYDGEWKNGMRHGRGEFKFKTGDIYTGGWELGKRTGEGSYTWTNGDRFIGNWKGDRMNGKGIFRYANGTSLESEFINDARVN